MTKPCNFVAGVAVAMAAPAATAAVAAPRMIDANTSDVRCLAVSLALSGSDDKEAAQAGMMSTLYFAGLVEGRDPKADVMELAAGELETLSQDQLMAAAEICGDYLSAKGDSWEKKGQELEAAGR